MRLKTVRFITIFAIALAMSLHSAFGSVGAITECCALAAAVVLLVLIRGREPAFALTFAAAGFLFAALMLGYILITPVNAQFARVTAAAPPPPNWGALLDQVRYTDGIRHVLQMIALSALVISVILETPGTVTGSQMPGRRLDRAA